MQDPLKQLSQRILKAVAPPATFEDLPRPLAHLFTLTVQLEAKLEAGHDPEIQLGLGRFVVHVLHTLQGLWPDRWLLRTPCATLHRYAAAAVLVQPLRQGLADVHHYWVQGQERDVMIALEIVLKRACELGMRLDFSAIYATEPVIRALEQAAAHHP